MNAQALFQAGQKPFQEKKIKRRAITTLSLQTTARIGTRLTKCILMGQERIQWKK